MKKSAVLNLDKLNYGNDKSTMAFMLFLPGSSAFTKEVNSEPFDIIACLRKGLPKETLINILETTCISGERLSNILHINPRQLSRHEPGQRLSPEQSNFLYELSLLYVRGEDVFGDRATFEHWLQRPQIAFGNQTCLDMLDTTEGFRMVDDLLSRVEYGFFS